MEKTYTRFRRKNQAVHCGFFLSKITEKEKRGGEREGRVSLLNVVFLRLRSKYY